MSLFQTPAGILSDERVLCWRETNSSRATPHSESSLFWVCLFVPECLWGVSVSVCVCVGGGLNAYNGHLFHRHNRALHAWRVVMKWQQINQWWVHMMLLSATVFQSFSLKFVIGKINLNLAMPEYSMKMKLNVWQTMIYNIILSNQTTFNYEQVLRK